jgi:outer membrane protein insertion porin family
LNQRARHRCIGCVSVALAAFVLTTKVAPRAAGQGPGGFSSIPKTMFGGGSDEKREAVGPSLSATDEPVAEIRIIGNKTISTTQILNQLQTRVGRPFDPALVQRDVRKLASRGWFVDVQPAYEQGPGGRIVIFKVLERPVIRYVEYLGNKGIRTKKLSKETELKVGGPVDPYAVEEARRKLVELYHRNGYNNVQITVLEGNQPMHKGVVFVINEGTAQKIWKLEFVGNKFVTARRLKTRVESKPPMMYIFKGFVDREQIDGDVERLTSYYRSFGFFQAKVGRQLVFNEKGNWLTLRFVIHEGPRYQVEDVSFIGNKIFASESLAMGTQLLAGQPFEQAKMNGDVEWLKELYGSQGYVFADIRADPIFSEEAGKLKLMYHIDEGKRWRVGNIYVHIEGENPHTKIQTALNRLSFRSGEIVDIREVRASERRLQASQLFMTDPVRGVMPKITYQIQDLEESELARGENGFRGQSPDGVSGESRAESGEQRAESRELGARSTEYGVRSTVGQPPALSSSLYAPSSTGPPLVAPPGHQPGAPPKTYRVQPPDGFVGGEDQVDVHLYIGDESAEEAPVSLSPTAIRHEVRRAPYDGFQAATPANAPAASAPSVYSQPAERYQAYHYAENRPSARNAYQHLTIRTQSPYQPATTGAYPSAGAQPAPTGNLQTAPAPNSPAASGAYAAAGYGGQSIGATGPESIPAGNNPYAVRQAAITEPQLPPQTGGSSAQVYGTAQAGPPPFGPPPLDGAGAPLVPQYAAPQYAAPPAQIGPPPIYAPGPPLPPDPNITPVTPLPSNPQIFPYVPQDPFTPMLSDPAVDIHVGLTEGQTGRLMLGVAVNSDAGLVGQILLDEQNFDWKRFPTSWEDFASGRAWRGGGQRFRLEAAPGTEVQRYLVSFQEPYLWDTPVTFGVSGSYFDRRYIDWDEQRLGGRAFLGYQWTQDDVSATLAYRAENVNIRNISTPSLEELAEVEGDNSLHGFRLGIANDTRDSPFLATQGHFVEVSFEQVVGSFVYPRGTIDARKYFLLRERPDHSGRHVLTLSTSVGLTGNDTPIYENFYAGGYSTLRGFDFRGVSPVDPIFGVRVGGEFKWVNSVEYLFPLTADDMIHGVAFVDFGTVERDIEIKDFRVSPGFGFRITVPAMGPAPIALDFGFPVVSADFDDEQMFSFNIGLQR